MVRPILPYQIRIMNKSIYLFTFLLFSLVSFAQETTGRLEGKIVDIKNNPIEFATIVVTDVETNFKYGSTSQTDGLYTINNLPPGINYKIDVSFLGYAKESLLNVTINLGATTVKNFTLSEENQSLDEVLMVRLRGIYFGHRLFQY